MTTVQRNSTIDILRGLTISPCFLYFLAIYIILKNLSLVGFLLRGNSRD